MLKNLSALSLLVFSAACSSVEEVQKEILPFHVAVAPITLMTSDRIRIEDDADDIENQLLLAPEGLTEAVQKELANRCFERVSILTLTEDQWAREAIEKKADLVVVCTTRYRELVRTAKNEKFWLNLPLFFLGGPFNYWVDDRDYYLGIELQANVYEWGRFGSNPILGSEGGEEPALGWQSLLLDSRIPIDAVELDFADRVEWSNVGQIALSFIVPANFLAKDTEKAQAIIAEKVKDELASKLADKFLADERFKDPSDVPFRIEDPQFVPSGSNYQMNIELAAENRRGRIDAYMIKTDAQEDQIGAPERLGQDGEFSRYRIRGTVPRSAETVQLIVQSGASNEAIWRSFTFNVKEKAEESKL